MATHQHVAPCPPSLDIASREVKEITLLVKIAPSQADQEFTLELSREAASGELLVQIHGAESSSVEVVQQDEKRSGEITPPEQSGKL